MAKLSFTAEIKILKANPYILVSAEQALRLKPGWKKPLPVRVQINGKPDTPWRINMMPVGDGSFYLYLHGNVRKASGTKTGDKVRVAVSFDAEYRSGPMEKKPAWFNSALKKNPTAAKNWDHRNLKRALDALSGSPERFMTRSWNNGK